MELLAHGTPSSRQDAAEMTTEFAGDNAKENPEDMNISLTARERLLKKLQGIRSAVSTVGCIVMHQNMNLSLCNDCCYSLNLSHNLRENCEV